MSGFPALIGSLTASYTTTQYNAGLTPLLGQVYRDGAKRYIFLKNTGATAITANLCATSLATDINTYGCEIFTGNSNVQQFAGARVSSADSVAQNEYAWYQISGPATLTADAAGTTVNKTAMSSNATAGNIELAVEATAADGKYAFCTAATTTTSGTVAVTLYKNLWGA